MPPEPVTFDETLGDPGSAWVLDRLTAGDWRSVHEFCETREDPLERAQLIALAAELDRFPEDWVESTQGDAFPLAARGRFLIAEAWRIRGSGRASEVARENWDPFHDTLRAAADDLLRATDLRPDDPVPWAHLLTAGQGLSVPKDQIIDWFEQSVGRSPGFPPAYMLVVSPLALKWGGSHELMFSVARSSLDTAVGSFAPVALTRAHYEGWLYKANFENDADGARAYFKQPQVVDELERAAAHSVLAPAPARNFFERRALSHFAYALAFTGDAVPADRRHAAALFDALGDDGVPGTLWSMRWSQTGGARYAQLRAHCRRAR